MHLMIGFGPICNYPSAASSEESVIYRNSCRKLSEPQQFLQHMQSVSTLWRFIVVAYLSIFHISFRVISLAARKTYDGDRTIDTTQ